MSTKGKVKAEQPKASTTSTSKAPAMPAAPPARRAPVGKVIHFFSDSPTQGYDGQKFSEAYQVVLKQAAESSQAAGAAPVASTSQLAAASSLEGDKTKQEQAVKEEDVRALVSLTGLSEEDARGVFTRAGSANLTKASREYLHRSSDSSSSRSGAPIATSSEASESVEAVVAQ